MTFTKETTQTLFAYLFDEKKTNDDIEKDVENCTKVFTLSEFSRETGIRIELLRRFINKQTRQMKNEAWEKISPAIRELLGENDLTRPRRIGPAYRRHPELVEMFSAQKVLLDEFAIFSDSDKKAIIAEFTAVAGKSEPTSYESLSNIENQLMGCFLAMDSATQDEQLSKLTVRATADDYLLTPEEAAAFLREQLVTAYEAMYETDFVPLSEKPEKPYGQDWDRWKISTMDAGDILCQTDRNYKTLEIYKSLQ